MRLRPLVTAVAVTAALVVTPASAAPAGRVLGYVANNGGGVSVIDTATNAVTVAAIATSPNCSGASKRARTATPAICMSVRRIWQATAIAPPRIVRAASLSVGLSEDSTRRFSASWADPLAVDTQYS